MSGRIRAFVLPLLFCLVAQDARAQPAIVLDRPADAIVVDGDTIQIDGRVVDFFGVDAPELGQDCAADGIAWTCGMAAAYDLRKRLALARGPLVCEPRAAGASGTVRAQCIVDAHDLGALQVEAGLAVALPEGPLAYRALEGRARDARLGIWHSGFELPRNWRRRHRRPQPGCPVRGLRTGDGRRLYVTPFDAPATVPADAETDGFWCSDDVVRMSGYRRPGEMPAPSAPGEAATGSRR